ncbi:MAG TPA: nickel-dependent lactate racemase [Pyrinomonadaceae bacterium]|nr:nickel-dependent lactate racemase [Pyrinomonadaceae bacterium]
MPQMQLAYGSQLFDFAYDERFQVLASSAPPGRPLTDLEIGAALDRPIESLSLEELLAPGDSVLIVTSDATRATASAQIVNLLVRRIIQQGISPADIAIIFATGIHRPTTAAEKQELLTQFITQRIRVLDHDAFDERQHAESGETERGMPAELNRALKEFTHVVLTGGIGFHYFAGFTGGRKSICPGLASARTIAATHMLALDFERGGRRAGVGTGLLDGNAVNEECERVAALVEPAFSINVVVDEQGRACQMFAGQWRAAHRQACAKYLLDHSITITEKRELVIVSCGGYPYDINMIQAHKALDMAASACQAGGTIVLLAECRDGFGRSDFLKWFETDNSAALEARLRQSYEVNGQTAWSLMSKAERFRVILISELADADVKRMRMTPARSLAAALTQADSNARGFVLPRGAALLPVHPLS